MLVKLINKNCQNIKKTVSLFLFPKGHMHQNQSVFSFFCYSFVETIFKMKPQIFIIQYADTFNFAHTIYPKWSLKPL